MKRRIKWIAINGCMSALMVAGVSYGVKGAENVFTFFVFLFAITSVLSLPNKEIRDKIHASGRCVPAWLMVTLDVITTGYLVWNGMWLIAVVYAIMSMVNDAMHEKKW